MHPHLRLVFDHFKRTCPNVRVGIIGSAVQDYEKAKDIDVLVPLAEDWPALMKQLRTKYHGWDTRVGHVRRANLRILFVPKQVQVLQREQSPTLASHPDAVLLEDGQILHEGKHFQKSAPKFLRR